MTPRQFHIFCRENHLNVEELRSLICYVIGRSLENDKQYNIIDDYIHVLFHGCTPISNYTRTQCYLELNNFDARELQELCNNI